MLRTLSLQHNIEGRIVSIRFPAAKDRARIHGAGPDTFFLPDNLSQSLFVNRRVRDTVQLPTIRLTLSDNRLPGIKMERAFLDDPVVSLNRNLLVRIDALNVFQLYVDGTRKFGQDGYFPIADGLNNARNAIAILEPDGIGPRRGSCQYKEKQAETQRDPR
jgi:hypothetical protein